MKKKKKKKEEEEEKEERKQYHVLTILEILLTSDIFLLFSTKISKLIWVKTRESSNYVELH